jgi:hypothetical protein
VATSPKVVERSALKVVIRLIWFILVGWWLSGVWLAAAYALLVIIIGLPILSGNALEAGGRLPDRDSNPDSTIQSRVSYRWTIRH